MASSLGEIKLNIDLPQWSTIMSPLSGYSVRFDMGGSTNMPISTTPADALADLVRKWGKDTDLSSVKSAFEALETEKQQNIGKALDGVVEMAAIEKPNTRRFVLAYFFGSESHVVDGIAYEGAETSGEDDLDETRVHIQVDGGPLDSEYNTMAALRRHLADRKIQHRIKYID